MNKLSAPMDLISSRHALVWPVQHRPTKIKADTKLEHRKRWSITSSRKVVASIDTEARRKAAAWAWYQRGCVEVAPTRRITGASATSRKKPMSRFKLEAVREPDTHNMLWDCGSRLYDSAELFSFAEYLDRSLQGQLSWHHPLSMPHNSASAIISHASSKPLEDMHEEQNMEQQDLQGEETTVSSRNAKKSVLARPLHFIAKIFHKVSGLGQKRHEQLHEHRHIHHLHHSHWITVRRSSKLKKYEGEV